MALAKNRFVQLGFALTQNALVGGVLFGWASIDRTMLSADRADGGVGLTNEQSAFVFTVASSLAMASSLVLGVVLDFFGPRVCAIVSCAITAFGAQIVAQFQGRTAFAVGICMLSFGGPGIGSAIIHISNLFPNNEYLMISVLSGSIAVSFSIFALFDALWQNYDSVTYQTLFGYYAIAVALSALVSFVLYPDTPYEQIRPDDDQLNDLYLYTHDEQGEHIDEDGDGDGDSGSVDSDVRENDNDDASDKKNACDSHRRPCRPRRDPERQSLMQKPESDMLWHERMDIHGPAAAKIQRPSIKVDELQSYLRDSHLMARKSESFMASSEALTSHDLQTVRDALSLKDQPFLKQFMSAAYLRALLVFTVCCYSTNFTILSTSTELSDTARFTLPVQRRLVVDFTLIMSVGTIASVIAGASVDRIGVVNATYITLLFGQLETLMRLFAGDRTAVMEASFYMYTLFRQFSYPVFIASLTDKLGFKYFGVLLGAGFALAGAVQLSQAALAAYIHRHDCWNEVHAISFVLFTALLICPALDARDHRRHLDAAHRVVLSASKLNAAESSTSPTTSSSVSSKYGSMDESAGH